MKEILGIGIAAGLFAGAALAPGEAAAQPAKAAVSPAEVARVPVAQARERVREGRALLVCAYESDDKFAAMKLEGAISWNALQKRLPALDKKAEIILYCA
ncbi:MAG: hypothetical protein M0R80_05385 [Proteobacteria bacterium]|nr:hypothetical protein [Pseudomonadota bacterium]